MIQTGTTIKCYHCGLPCDDESFKVDGKHFCCYGCKVVCELINDSNLCEYYNIESHPGLNAKNHRRGEYEYLNDVKLRKKLAIDHRCDCDHTSTKIYNFERIRGAGVADRVEAYTRKYNVGLVVISTQLSCVSNEVFLEMLDKLKCPLLIVPEKYNS